MNKQELLAKLNGSEELIGSLGMQFREQSKK